MLHVAFNLHHLGQIFKLFLTITSLENSTYQRYRTLNWLGSYLHEVENLPSQFRLPKRIRCYWSGWCDVISGTGLTTWWKQPTGDIECINHCINHWYSWWGEIITKHLGYVMSISLFFLFCIMIKYNLIMVTNETQNILKWNDHLFNTDVCCVCK